MNNSEDITAVLHLLTEASEDAKATMAAMHGPAWRMPSWEEYVRLKNAVNDSLRILTGRRP